MAPGTGLLAGQETFQMSCLWSFSVPGSPLSEIWSWVSFSLVPVAVWILGAVGVPVWSPGVGPS